MDTWQKCLDRLEGELSAQQFNTWIRPLQVIEDEHTMRLLAPNRFVLDWVNNRFLERINKIEGITHTETSIRLQVIRNRYDWERPNFDEDLKT